MSRSLERSKATLSGRSLACVRVVSAMAIALGAVTSLACSAHSSSGDSSGETTSDELVSNATFQHAVSIVQGIDYLPFDYVDDGCTARSLYMAMELAAEGIEANAIFAYAKPGHLLRVGNIQWSFHVAPMLLLGPDYDHAQPMVVDPGLSQSPLTPYQWIAKMGSAEPDGGVDAAAADYPDYAITPGSESLRARDARVRRNVPADVKSFQAMPGFSYRDITSACVTMANALGLARAPETKAAKLVARTGELARALRDRGKLTDWSESTMTQDTQDTWWCLTYFRFPGAG